MDTVDEVKVRVEANELEALKTLKEILKSLGHPLDEHNF